MPSIVDAAFTSGLATIRQMRGRSVVYSDGTHTVTIPLANVGKTDFEVEEDGVVVATWNSRDYLINAADIVLNGVQTLPIKGHTITEVINGVSKVFTVLAPDGEQVFQFSDTSAQTQLRIHTKETT